MDIKDFKELGQILIESFPRAYSKEVLNKVWPIWKHLSRHDLEVLVLELKTANQPRCLASLGNRLLLLRKQTKAALEPETLVKTPVNRPNSPSSLVSPKPLSLETKHNDWSDQGLATLLDSEKAESAWELVLRAKKNRD